MIWDLETDSEIQPNEFITLSWERQTRDFQIRLSSMNPLNGSFASQVQFRPIIEDHIYYFNNPMTWHTSAVLLQGETELNFTINFLGNET